MQELLSKIIEMDEKARRIRKKAEREKEHSEEEIEQLRQQIYDDYIARARKRVEKNIAVDRKKAELAYAQSEKHAEEVKARMHRLYDENGDRWVDEIVARVIG